MDETTLCTTITDSLEDCQVQESDGSFFFFHGAERKFPFATLVTTDSYDSFSNLSRPGVFRLNIGITKASFQFLCGETPTVYDFTALDQFMPHPVYGGMAWICVLNPSDATLPRVKELLAEAFELAGGRQVRRTSQA